MVTQFCKPKDGDRVGRGRCPGAIQRTVLLCLTTVLACGCSDVAQRAKGVKEDTGLEKSDGATPDKLAADPAPGAGQSRGVEQTSRADGQRGTDAVHTEKDSTLPTVDPVFNEQPPGGSPPTESGEPLPPGHEVMALYEAGKVAEARAALEKWVRNSAEAADAVDVHREFDLKRKLGHSLAVNLTVYCFKLDRQARGDEQFPPQLPAVAKLAREAMLPIIDDVKRLEAAGSPLATERVIEQREYAERQLADLIPLEIDALKKLGREDEAKRLATETGQLLRANGLKPTGEPPITAIVLRRTWLGGSETIEFYGNGSAARAWTGPPRPGVIPGKSFGQLSEKDFKEFVLELRKLDYLSLKDEYRGNAHDADRHVLTVSSQTGDKTVKDVMAGAPEELERFFNSLRNRAETIGWKSVGFEEE